MNLAQTKALLSEFNIQPTRSLGQNFLVDERVVARIGDLADLTPEDLVIEIGPGVGHLTVELASRAGWVIAIEIDHHLLAALSHNLANFGTVTLIHGDALTQNLRQLCQDWPGPVKVVANLPYYVTTDLMLKLMTEVPYCQSLTLMMQKEAAERIMAPVGQQRVQPSWHHRSLQRQIAALRAPLAATARISFSRLSALDTAGAALLTDLIGAQRTLQLAQTEDGLPPASQSLLTTVAQALAQSPPTAPPVKHSWASDVLERIGAAMLNLRANIIALLGFTGLTLQTLAGSVLRPSRWRLTAVVAQIEQTGLDAVPIVALLTFMVGAVIAFLGATVLANFGVQYLYRGSGGVFLLARICGVADCDSDGRPHRQCLHRTNRLDESQ